MKRKLLRVGNSRAVRLPKTMLEQTGIDEEVTLEVREDAIIIRPARVPRAGWEDAARAFMAAGGDDEDWEAWDNAELDAEWDEAEWTW